MEIKSEARAVFRSEDGGACPGYEAPAADETKSPNIHSMKQMLQTRIPFASVWAMKSATLSARLRSDFGTLSVRLQEAARWVIDHPADVALLTTREQARRSGLARHHDAPGQHFGLKGYEELRKLHADTMRRRPDNYRGRAQELVERREAEGDPALVQDIFSSLSQHMQALSSPDAAERFGAAAEMIAGAERVYCLGQRSSFPVAYIFYYVRSLFGSASVLVDGVVQPAWTVCAPSRQPTCCLRSRSIRMSAARWRPRATPSRAARASSPSPIATSRHSRPLPIDRAGSHRNAVILPHHGAGLCRDGMPRGARCRAAWR